MKRGIFAALVLAASCAAISQQARADVVWTLHDVTFNDGGALSAGQFTVDVYGYLSDGSASATTTDGTKSNGTGGPLTGALYNDSLVSASINYPTDDTVTLYWATPPGYYRSLTLTFADALTAPVSDNVIVSGYECVGWTCPNTTGTRYVTGGYAAAGAIPEAPTWAMMIVGAGMLGYAASQRRVRAAMRAA